MPEKNGHHPRASKTTSKNGNRNGTARAPRVAPDDQVVMTLRISRPDREKLHRYTMNLSKIAGQKVSYNAAMIELIRGV